MKIRKPDTIALYVILGLVSLVALSLFAWMMKALLIIYFLSIPLSYLAMYHGKIRKPQEWKSKIADEWHYWFSNVKVELFMCMLPAVNTLIAIAPIMSLFKRNK